MVWNECWGTYSATGPYDNVAIGGSPAGSMHGLDLGQAKAAGYGKGVQFTYDAKNNQIKIEINLIGYGCKSNMQYVPNRHYVSGNFTYDWYGDFYYSTDGGKNYALAKQELIARHGSTQGLAYVGNWQLSNVNYSTIISLPANFTHVKIEVRGEELAQRHQNVYTRQVVISTYKPWAIRKNGTWASLSKSSGYFKIRNSNNWVDKSNELLSDVGKDNKGHSRIRKNSVWKQQNKIGNE